MQAFARIVRRVDPPDFTRRLVRGEPGRIGIALSGGGIRSASYCLGALQVLREPDGSTPGSLFERADVVTAVSGGAYIASAVAVSDSQGSEDPTKTSRLSPEIEDSLTEFAPWSRGSPEEDHLRKNSSYLAETLVGKLGAVSIWLRGLILNLAAVGFVVVLAGVFVGWILYEIHPGMHARAGVAGAGPVEGWPMAVALAFVAAGFSIFAADASFDIWSRRSPAARRLSSWLLSFGLAGVAVAALPYLLILIREASLDPDGVLNAVRRGLNITHDADPQPVPRTGTDWLLVTQVVAVANAVLATVRFMTAKGRTYYAPLVATLAGPLLILLPFVAVVDDAAAVGPRADLPLVRATPTEELVLLLALVGGMLALLELRFNCNKTSLHYFYARQLSRAFALRRVSAAAAGAYPDDRLPDLASARPERPPSPAFVYCAAANTTGDHASPPGRNAVPFDFSHDFCGGDDAGTLPTVELAGCIRGLSVPAAVAISGAAFSPVMGKHTRRPYTFLMALFNLRLGMWVPNPRFIVARPAYARDATRFVRRWGAWAPRPGVRYLLFELLGLHRLNRRYVYVTDGGHYDNLGLVELLRRGCTTIYCFDASGDAVDTFNTLGEAIALARSDLMVDVRIEPECLAPRTGSDLSPVTCAVGSFRYPGSGSQQGVEGELVFVKASVTPDAPWDLRAFRRKDPRFPGHSTIDQLFTDQKLESYRALGSHGARAGIAALADHRARRERLSRAGLDYAPPPSSEEPASPALTRKGMLARLRRRG
ncbi:MAG: patatin-like phospholipase family protein [Actinomycetota bacterium]